MRTSLLVRYQLFDIMNPTSIWLLCDGNRREGAWREGAGEERGGGVANEEGAATIHSPLCNTLILSINKLRNYLYKGS